MARLPIPECSEHQGVSAAMVSGRAPLVATARELARALATHEIDDLRTAQPELGEAVVELALAAAKEWAIDADDPVVVLLRALARLSLEAPEVTSTAAGSLVTRFDRRPLAREGAVDCPLPGAQAVEE